MNRFAMILALVVTALGTTALGQGLPVDQYFEPITLDSGWVSNDTDEYGVIYSEIVSIPGVTSIRLYFNEVTLGAAPTGKATILRMTSLLDGGQQPMQAVHIEQWQRTSAFFNGNMVLVEILAAPDAAPSRVIGKQALVSPVDPDVFGPESICDVTDDRTLLNDARCARLATSATGGLSCTAWLIDDFHGGFLTAGHCGPPSTNIVEFNVPLSTATCGVVNHPGPDDQYAIDPASIQTNGGGGVGNDWAYFGCFPNPGTGLTPKQAQGTTYVLAAVAPPVGGQDIRITGYGSTTAALSSCEWYGVGKTHVGPYASHVGTTITYRTDTTGGNSGSPVVDESTGLAIGIHTHGGCGDGGAGANAGTAIEHTDLQNALANPLGVLSAFSVTPTAAVTHDGPVGGPFTNPLTPYTVTNDTGVAITYSVTTGPLLNASTSGGVLADGASVNVDITLDPGVGILAPGLHADSVTFTDVTHGGTQVRDHLFAVGLTTITSTDTPIAIPDGDPVGTTSTITIPAGCGEVITDLDVMLDVTHTWVGDLIFTLEHNGTPVTIVDRPGYTGSGFGCSTDNFDNAILDDEGTGGAIEDQCTADLTSPPNYTPQNPLSAFDGMDLAGTWTLTVSDNAGADIGTLESWSLIVALGNPCPADLNGDGTVNVIDLLALLTDWGPGPSCADLNGDGLVNVVDLLQMLTDWGPC